MPDAVVQLEYPATIPIDKKGVITKRVFRYDVATMFVPAYEIAATESPLFRFTITARMSTFPNDVGTRIVVPPTTITVAPILLARSSFAMTTRMSVFPSDMKVSSIAPPTTVTVVPALPTRSSFVMVVRMSTFPSDRGVKVVAPPVVSKIAVEQIITSYRVT